MGKNQFALLDDDAPDNQSTPAVQATPETSPDPNVTSPQNKSQRGRGGPASRGGRYYQRGGAKSTPTSPEVGEESAPIDRQKKYDGDSPRGRGRGRGGERGRGRGGGRGRGREYDRHSGTLPDSEKRVHQGWGGDDGNRELQNEEQAVADATAETTTLAPGDDWTGAAPPTGTDDWAGAGTTDDAAWGAPIEGAAAPAAETTEPAKAEGGEYRRRRRDDEPEEDDNTLTLDQYLAKKKESESSLLPKLEGPRKVEGDDKLWKNAVPVSKPEDDSYFVGKTKSAPKAKAKKAEKEFIEIEPKFERPSRGGRGRGGRGEGRGEGRGGGRGRGRGGDRYAAGRTQRVGEVDVDDQSAFPSLA